MTIHLIPLMTPPSTQIPPQTSQIFVSLGLGLSAPIPSGDPPNLDSEDDSLINLSPIEVTSKAFVGLSSLEDVQMHPTEWT